MSRTAQAVADLSYVLERGAQRRRHRFTARYATIAFAAAVFAVANALLYWLLANRTGDFDIRAGWPVLIAMAAIPPGVSAGIAWLAGSRPLFSAVTLGTLAAYIFATAVLSALRLPLSYSSIVLSFAICVLAMTYIAVRLWTTRRERIVLLDFPRAGWLREQLAGGPAISPDPAANPPDADVVLIDVATHHTPAWSQYLSRAYMRGVAIMPWPRYLELQQGRVDVAHFDISDIAYSTAQLVYSRLKRPLELAAVILTAPLWLTLLGVIGLVVWERAGGPILYTQLRRGQGERNFRLIKFRTMHCEGDSTPARPGDARLVPGLRWLRHTRLDELPQLVNVLRGEMSLVGPRPEIAEIADSYERALPAYLDRRLVLPGMTGWAQIHGIGSKARGTAAPSLEEAEYKLGYDLYYVKNLSFDLDMLILARTLRGLYRLARSG